jgi:hypothetical protein
MLLHDSYAAAAMDLADAWHKRSKLDCPVMRAWIIAVQRCGDKSHALRLGLMLRQEPYNIQLQALMEDWDEIKLTSHLSEKTWIGHPLVT